MTDRDAEATWLPPVSTMPETEASAKPMVEVEPPDAETPARLTVTVCEIDDVEPGDTDETTGVPETPLPVTILKLLVATPETDRLKDTTNVGLAEVVPTRAFDAPRVIDEMPGSAGMMTGSSCLATDEPSPI